MKFGNMLAAASAVSLLMAPITAQAAAQPSPPRVGSELSEAEGLAGDNWPVVLVAIVAGIFAVWFLTDDDEDDPVSP